MNSSDELSENIFSDIEEYEINDHDTEDCNNMFI